MTSDERRTRGLIGTGLFIMAALGGHIIPGWACVVLAFWGGLALGSVI